MSVFDQYIFGEKGEKQIAAFYRKWLEKQLEPRRRQYLRAVGVVFTHNRGYNVQHDVRQRKVTVIGLG